MLASNTVDTKITFNLVCNPFLVKNWKFDAIAYLANIFKILEQFSNLKKSMLWLKTSHKTSNFLRPKKYPHDVIKKTYNFSQSKISFDQRLVDKNEKHALFFILIFAQNNVKNSINLLWWPHNIINKNEKNVNS